MVANWACEVTEILTQRSIKVTSVTSRCVRRSVMSAMDFYHSIVSVCRHFGTTPTQIFLSFRCVRIRTFWNDCYVPLCSPLHYVRGTFFVPLCPHADITKRPLSLVSSMVDLIKRFPALVGIYPIHIKSDIMILFNSLRT